MTRHVYVYNGDGASRHVLARGRVSATLKAYKIPGLWSNLDRGFWVRRERASDLLCALQADGFTLHEVAGDPR